MNTTETSSNNRADAVQQPPTWYRRDRGGFVYFITDGAAIKIGYSAWPEARRDALQGSHHLPLTIIDRFRGQLEDEAALHRHFYRLRIKGEWFRPSDEITAFIARLAEHRKILDKREVTIRDFVTGRIVEIMESRAAAEKDARDLIEIKRGYAKFKAWFDRKKSDDAFPSKEFEECAARCVSDLYVLACNGLTFRLHAIGPITKQIDDNFAKMIDLMEREKAFFANGRPPQ